MTNASCLCISVLKCRKATSDEIIDEEFVLEGYSKWKNIDLVTNEELSIIIYSQVRGSILSMMYVHCYCLLCRPAWKGK